MTDVVFRGVIVGINHDVVPLSGTDWQQSPSRYRNSCTSRLLACTV